MGNVRYLVSGDCAVTVEFGNEISPEINRKIRAFKIALEKEQIEGIVETVLAAEIIFSSHNKTLLYKIRSTEKLYCGIFVYLREDVDCRK